MPTTAEPVAKLDWIDLYDRRPTFDDSNSEGDVLIWWSHGQCTWEPWDQLPTGGTEHPTHWSRFPCLTR